MSSDDFWQKKHMYAKMNRLPDGTATPRPEPRPKIVVSVPADKDEHIVVLQKLLRDEWGILCDLSLGATNEQKAAAFLKLDRKLRELGILPGKPKK